MVAGIIAHPFAKLLWVGLMPDVEAYTIEHMHCLMPSPTSRQVDIVNSRIQPAIRAVK